MATDSLCKHDKRRGKDENSFVSRWCCEEASVSAPTGGRKQREAA